MTRRLHSSAAPAEPLPAKRESAALDQSASGAARNRSLPSSSGGSLPLAFSAQQLAQALGYRDAASVYDLARRDPTFPKPVQFTKRTERRYLASDVQRWLESKA